MIRLVPMIRTNGRLIVETWWNSFLDSLQCDQDLDRWISRRDAELKKFNATIIFGSVESIKMWLEFTTEEDATLFLLRFA